MHVKHPLPAETDPTTQMRAPQWQRAPAKASETQPRKRASKSVGFSSGLAFTCSLTYSLTPIGTKPIYLFTVCSSSQLLAISASRSRFRTELLPNSVLYPVVESIHECRSGPATPGNDRLPAYDTARTFGSILSNFVAVQDHLP